MPQPVLEAAIPDPMQVHLLSSSPASLASQQSNFGDVQANEAEQVFIVVADGAIMVVGHNNNRMAANPG